LDLLQKIILRLNIYVISLEIELFHLNILLWFLFLLFRISKIIDLLLLWEQFSFNIFIILCNKKRLFIIRAWKKYWIFKTKRTLFCYESIEIFAFIKNIFSFSRWVLIFL